MYSLQTAKDILNETQQKLAYGRDRFVTSEDMFIKYEISNEIIYKLQHITNELGRNENDLHKHASTLRFTLETLINTKLLVDENDYFLKLYFSIYIQQVNKTEAMVLRIKDEIEILKKYSKFYETTVEKLKIDYADNPEKFAKEDERYFQSIKKVTKEHINIFFSQLDELGFDMLIYGLENDILNQYTQKLEEHEKLKLNKAKELAKEEWFKQYINVNKQSSKVFKSLIDKRSWSAKAKAVGLEKEYSINYESTSSLLHFTSYSLFTSNKIKDVEIEYNYMILNQYIKQICDNLRAVTKVMILDIFEHEFQFE